jgi:hypothetical protein
VLETPLFGRFEKEDRRLVFAPTPEYDKLLIGLASLSAVIFLLSSFAPPVFRDLWRFIGLMLAAATFWGYTSLVRISFDLKKGTYRRRDGRGLLPRKTTGSVSNLDALVLITEQQPFSRAGRSGAVTYFLVLHWKNGKEPTMVVQQEERLLLPHESLDSRADVIKLQGARYAKSLGVPFYDNSHFASICPVPVF